MGIHPRDVIGRYPNGSLVIASHDAEQLLRRGWPVPAFDCLVLRMRGLLWIAERVATGGHGARVLKRRRFLSCAQPRVGLRR
jgi:hypothetical protein